MGRIAKSGVGKPKVSRSTRATKTNGTVAPPLESADALGQDQIARRAYELFVESGAEHGRDVEHWLTAERQLRQRAMAAEP